MTTAQQPVKPSIAAQRCAINQAICNYVAAHHPCDSATLFEVFGDCPTGAPSHVTFLPRKRFSLRIKNLIEMGDLRNVAPKGQLRLLMPGNGERAVPTRRVRVPAEDAPSLPAWVGQLVQPAQYDVMHGPVYRPGPEPALRPGALDHLRYRSLGHSC